jgi:hypothetical protein
MSIRAALLLGMFLVAAALVHGGFYTAGHDFVVNRFTGWYEFVPAEGTEEDDAAMPIRRRGGATVALTSPDLDARVPAPARRAERRVPVGR